MTIQTYKQIEVDDTYHSRGLRVLRLKEKKIMESSSIAKLGRELNDSYDSQIDNYCFDLRGVIHLSSKALGELMAFSEKHQGARRKNVGMTNIESKVRQILTITGLDQTHFDIRGIVEDCLD